MKKIDIKSFLRIAFGNAVASFTSLALTTDISSIPPEQLPALAALTVGGAVGGTVASTVGDVIKGGITRDEMDTIDHILNVSYFKSKGITSKEDQEQIILAVDMIINDDSRKVKPELLDPYSVFTIDKQVEEWLDEELETDPEFLAPFISDAVNTVKREIQKWVFRNNIFDIFLAIIDRDKQYQQQFKDIVEQLRIQSQKIAELNVDLSAVKEEHTYPYYETPRPANVLSCYIHRPVLENTIWNEIVEKRNSILVYGMGGIGKTETVKAFVRKLDHHKCEDTGISRIIWVDYLNGNLKDSLIQSVSENYPTKTREELWEYIQYLIQSHRDKLLIIIDNVEIPEDDLELNRIGDYPCRVLVTSRIANISNLLSFPVDVLPLEDCRQIFYTYYHGNDDNYYLDNILDLVDCHTVMIEMLAKTADYEEKSLDIFYKKLVDCGLRLSNEEVSSGHSLLNKERKVTEQLKILFKISGCPEEKKELLCQLSVIPAISFRYHEVKNWIQIDNKSSLEYLVRTGWLKSDGAFKTTYVMHSVVASAIRFQYENSLYEKCRGIIRAITREMDMSDQEHGSQKSYLIPFSWSISDVLRDKLCDEEDALFLTLLAHIYFDIGNYESAQHFFERALVIDIQAGADTSSDYYNLADISLTMDCYKDALKYLSKAIKIRKQIYSMNDDELLALYKMLAATLAHLNRLKWAEEIYLWTLHQYETKEECETLFLCTLYCDIAAFYREREYPGDLDKALEYYQKAEVGFKQAYENVDHPEMAAFYDSYALLYDRMGKYEEALNLLQNSLEMKRKLLNDEHPDIVQSYCSIGLMYYFLDDLPSALENLNKGLELANKISTSPNTNKASIYTNLGLVYRRMKEMDQALHYYSKSMEIRSILYPKNHPLILELRNNMAQVYVDKGELEKAETEYESLICAYEENNKGMTSAALATVCDNLSDLYRRLQKYSKALSICTKGMNMRESLFGKDSADYAYSLNNLGLIYYESKQLEEAKNCFIDALEIKKRQYPPFHSQVSLGHFNLALVHEKLAEEDDALNHYFEAIQIDQELGDDDSVVLSLYYVIDIYERNGRKEEAEYYRSFIDQE